MINRSKFKEKMPVLEIQKRKASFCEVELGLPEKEALSEAARCLNCKNSPCRSGCPVGVDIPGFISCIAAGENQKAYETILKDNILPSICGRVCPQEKQCEAKCIRAKSGEPVAIGRLERYAADNSKSINKSSEIKSNGKKVAVIGSGPSGLTCAGELCKKGYEAHIFEALHVPGGVLSYGIPAFRLPRNILENQLEDLKNMGVKIHTNTVVGKTLLLDDLFEMGFSAVYISTGAGLPKFMGLPGEGLPGVCSANEFLTRINLMKANNPNYDTPINIPKRIAIIGGGNVAMDAARCAVRIGCEKVFVIYRRTEDEMPARKDEITHAKEEGVEFIFLKTPVEFTENGGVLSGVRCASMKYAGVGDDGRKLFEKSSDDICEIEIDAAVIAIGNGANKILTESEKEILTKENGCIITEKETAKTSKKFVYAGGDAVIGAATVILAMEAGKRAAAQIDKDLTD